MKYFPKLTAIVLTVAGLYGCSNNHQADITAEIVDLKRKFVIECEDKIDETDLYDGSLEQIIDERKGVLKRAGLEDNEQWICKKTENGYKAFFSETLFPNPPAPSNNF